MPLSGWDISVLLSGPNGGDTVFPLRGTRLICMRILMVTMHEVAHV